MKIVLILTVLIGISSVATAQSSSADKQFLKSIFGGSLNVVYSQRIVNPGLSKHLKTFLNKDTVRNHHYDPDPENYLVLNEADRNEIIRQLDEMGSFQWPKKVLKHAERIPAADAQNLLSARFPGSWDVFYEQYGKNLYQFSKPIFFRNHTLSLFYYDARCGILCGKGHVAIYRLKFGKWEKWLTLDEWLS